MSSEVIEEKVITINLRGAYLASGKRAAPRAVRIIKEIAKRIANSDDVKIDNSLNMILWSRGKGKTLRKVSVKIQKLKDGEVRILPS
ncbi:MAG: 60S ribosomal protein L31 [Candidatus Methanomethyliaceae archaeon]|nr:60S ribosomal protein L31 [Candidatus Methanomethyliaceae archaeon]MDW7970679.1 50S ribosomal protein L31e [Nitrososphaerota archaeon]